MVQRIVSTGDIDPAEWRTIKDQLLRYGIVDAAYARALDHGERAKAHLSAAFLPSPEREPLLSLVDYVLSRDR
jgi:hypothetical protein